MTDEEVHLVGEDPLEHLAVVDLEMAGRIAAQLPAGARSTARAT